MPAPCGSFQEHEPSLGYLLSPASHTPDAAVAAIAVAVAVAVLMHLWMVDASNGSLCAVAPGTRAYIRLFPDLY